MLYPQNGDRIVAIDYVKSLHPMYSSFFIVIVCLVASLMLLTNLYIAYYKLAHIANCVLLWLIMFKIVLNNGCAFKLINYHY